MTGTERWHGTTGGYGNHGCRCDACREAQRVAMADWRARASQRQPLRHDYSTYLNWSCRCEICRAANTAAKRRAAAAAGP